MMIITSSICIGEAKCTALLHEHDKATDTLLLKYFCWTFGHWFIRRYTCFKLTRSCVVVRVTGLDRIVRPHYSLGWVHFGKKHSGLGLDFLPEVLTTFPFQAMVQNCLLHHPPYRVAEVGSLSANAKLSKMCVFGLKKLPFWQKLSKKRVLNVPRAGDTVWGLSPKN